MRAIVTGSKGFIGSHLKKSLIDRGYEVLGIDLKEGKDVIEELHEFKDGSFLKKYSDFKADVIFHMACFSKVPYSIKNPITTCKNNILSTSVALNFAAKNNIKRFIFSSSSSVNGDGEGPISPYAFQKLSSEIECKMYHSLYNLESCSLRYFNVYSEGQKACGKGAPVVSNWINSYKKGMDLFLYGNGNQTRDMTHISDVISANIFFAETEKNISGKSFDIGTGENISLNEIKEIFLKKYPSAKFIYKEKRNGDIFSSKADVNLSNMYGWSAKVSIRDGLNLCFDNK